MNKSEAFKRLKVVQKKHGLTGKKDYYEADQVNELVELLCDEITVLQLDIAELEKEVNFNPNIEDSKEETVSLNITVSDPANPKLNSLHKLLLKRK